MLELFGAIKNKLSHMAWSALFSGLVLLVLGMLTIIKVMVVQVVVGLFLIVNGFVFLFLALKLWEIRAEIAKHFKMR